MQLLPNVITQFQAISSKKQDIHVQLSMNIFLLTNIDIKQWPYDKQYTHTIVQCNIVVKYIAS